MDNIKKHSGKCKVRLYGVYLSPVDFKINQN